MNQVTQDINKICQYAIENAKEYSKNLDYSENSLNDVDEILELLHKDIITYNPNLKKDTEPTPSQISSMSLMWGAYIGEVIRKNSKKKFDWVHEDALGQGVSMHLKSDDKCRIFPLEKVYKRLTNGSCDDIPFFYQVMKKEMM